MSKRNAAGEATTEGWTEQDAIAGAALKGIRVFLVNQSAVNEVVIVGRKAAIVESRDYTSEARLNNILYRLSEFADGKYAPKGPKAQAGPNPSEGASQPGHSTGILDWMAALVFNGTIAKEVLEATPGRPMIIQKNVAARLGGIWSVVAQRVIGIYQRGGVPDAMPEDWFYAAFDWHSPPSQYQPKKKA